jgi:hypothetical protein
LAFPPDVKRLIEECSTATRAVDDRVIGRAPERSLTSGFVNRIDVDRDVRLHTGCGSIRAFISHGSIHERQREATSADDQRELGNVFTNHPK